MMTTEILFDEDTVFFKQFLLDPPYVAIEIQFRSITLRVS